MVEKDDPGTPPLAKRKEGRQEAAQAVRRFHAAVESGELEVDFAHATALLRRIEGAVVGLEAQDATE